MASIIAAMDALPAAIFSAADVRAMDRHAIEAGGIPAHDLMQRAGAAAFQCLRHAWPGARQIAVLSGAGNNAGDGFVIARLAREAGMVVQVACVGDPRRLAGAAAEAFRDFAAAGGSHRPFEPGVLSGAELIVDALLGIGIDRDVEGPMRAAIEAANAERVPIFALDLPSGLDAETGRVRGAAIRAARTMTFLALKSGLYLGDAPDHVGQLEFAGLGLPPPSQWKPRLMRLDAAAVAAMLPPRRSSAHKGEFGRVLVIGGHAMPGAARLTGEAALRAGAGVVTVATSAASVAAIVCERPELIVRPAAPAELARLAGAADAVAIGPGLGLDDGAAALFDAIAADGCMLIVDADALTLLSRRPRRNARWVLTPHPGEAARLLGCDTADIQRDRLGSAARIAERYGGSCLLKGARTIVATAEGTPWVCDRGNPGMATAGSGDVLTGVVAALIAGGSEPPLAAAAGAWIHATAGDRAAGLQPRGLIAGDLLAEIRHVVNAPWN